MGVTVDSNIVKNVASLRTEFLNKVKEAPATWMAAMMFVSAQGSDGSTSFAYASDAPKVRKWVDERMPVGIKSGKYTIIHERFENSISATTTALRRDNLGLIPASIRGMAVRAINFPNSILSQLRVKGADAKSLCWDEAPFHYNAHSWGDSGAQPNKHAQTGVTVDAVTADYYTAEAAMLGWKDSRGEVDDNRLYELDLVVVHGLAMRQVMDKVFNSEKLSDGSSNPLYKKARTQLDLRITGNGWILENQGAEIKPYGLVEEFPLELTNTDVMSDKGFMRGEVSFGTEWVGNGFYGDPSWSHLVGALS